MRLAATRTRLATLAAVALTVGAVAAPSASAVPVDPWAGGLVTSPDVHKVPSRTGRSATKRANPQHGGLIVSPDRNKVPARTAKKPPLEKRSGI